MNKRNMELLVYHLESAGDLMKKEDVSFSLKLFHVHVGWSLLHVTAMYFISLMKKEKLI